MSLFFNEIFVQGVNAVRVASTVLESYSRDGEWFLPGLFGSTGDCHQTGFSTFLDAVRMFPGEAVLSGGSTL